VEVVLKLEKVIPLITEPEVGAPTKPKLTALAEDINRGEAEITPNVATPSRN
jgi:hypothetical protein